MVLFISKYFRKRDLFVFFFVIIFFATIMSELYDQLRLNFATISLIIYLAGTTN